MSAKNTALLVMVAIVALIVGAAIKTTQNTNQHNALLDHKIDSRALLSARLLKGDIKSDAISGDDSSSVGEQLGKITLVNFWASWCAPCRNEMPLFETVYRGNKSLGFQIIGIAIDSPDKAQAMLDSMDITYPILYAEMSGMQVMESAGNAQGFLPYTILLDADGNVLDKALGEIHAPQIQAWLDDYL